MDAASAFLAQAFPTWKEIETHREVVDFAIGILADTDASPITNHVATVIVQITHNQLDSGEEPSIMNPYPQYEHLPLLESFEKEGNVSTVINPHLCRYPSCGCPLAEVLSNTELVYIRGIDENDPLQLSPSQAQIIVKLYKVEGKEYDRLWKALYDIHANIIALLLQEVRSANVTRLGHLPHLKYIKLWHCSEASGEDLAASIEAWGDQSQLTYCHLKKVPIPRSVMTGLCKCTHLIHLTLGHCNLHDKLDVFMASPPPGLRELGLWHCSLHGSDVDHITQSIQAGRLTHLEKLDITDNPVGAVAVAHLLEALISTRPHKQLRLDLRQTGVHPGGDSSDEDEEPFDLPCGFKSVFKAKLTGTNIEVQFKDDDSMPSTPEYTDEDREEDTDEDTAEDTDEDTAEDTAEDTDEDIYWDTAEDTAEDTDEDIYWDTAKDTDEDTAEDTAEDTDEDTAEDTAEDTDEDIYWDTAEDTAEDTDEDIYWDTAKDTDEDIYWDTAEDTDED